MLTHSSPQQSTAAEMHDGASEELRLDLGMEEDEPAAAKAMPAAAAAQVVAFEVFEGSYTRSHLLM